MKKTGLFFILHGIALSLGLIAMSCNKKGGVILFFNEYQSGFLDVFFIFLTKAVEVPVFVFLAFILLFKNYRASLQMSAVGLLSLISSGLLKAFFLHPRPILYFKEENILEVLKLIKYSDPYTGFTSFPSGHTTAAFALMLTISLLYPKRWIIILCAFLSIGTGLSRIYLINHFIEDVIAGSLLGVLIAVIVHLIFEYLEIKNGQSIYALFNKKKT